MHGDVCGPIETKLKEDAHCFVTIIQKLCTRITLYPVSTKSEVLNVFKHFSTFAERLTGKRLKYLNSDGDEEYIGYSFQYFLEACIIKFEFTVSSTPQLNGAAEQTNCTHMDIVYAMMYHNEISKIL